MINTDGSGRRITTPFSTGIDKISPHLGIAISHARYFGDHQTFLSIGLRYTEAQVFLKAHEHMPGFDFESSFNEYYLKHFFVSVPLYIGRTFQPRKNSGANVRVYGGLSFGLCGLGSITTHNTYLMSADNDDRIYLTPDVFPTLPKDRFYSSFDIGVKATPFNFPNLTVGVDLSMDLTKTPTINVKGTYMRINPRQRGIS